MARISHRKNKNPLALFDFLEDFGAQRYRNISVAANSEQGTSHDLGKVPSVVWIYRVKGGHVEHGDTADTSSTFYLENRGTSDAVVDVLVFP